MRSLDETLAYEHDGVIEKLQTVYGVGVDEARDLFVEAKRWLWLQGKASSDRAAGRDVPDAMAITPSLTMLDEAWHTFILFTRDYMTFCGDYLGEYIHHRPNAGPHAADTTDADTADLTPALEATMSYVYDQLGADTLIKWYFEYQDKYATLDIRFAPTRADPLAA